VALALAGNISEQLWRKQLPAVVGEEGVHRPVGDQVATPPRRIQLVIAGRDRTAHAGSLPTGSRQRELQDRPNKPRPDEASLSFQAAQERQRSHTRASR
jgi:hypothetical protein